MADALLPELPHAFHNQKLAEARSHLKITQALERGVIWKRADGECEFILADVSVHWMVEIAITWGIVAANLLRDLRSCALR